MTERVILLSGAVSSGKSTLGRSLEATEGATVFRTREILQRRVAPGQSSDRKVLQAEGELLDKETRHRWVLDEFKSWREKIEQREVLVIDSVRTLEQVSSFREAFGPAVTHVHLTAPPEQLEERYNSRPQTGLRPYSFAEVRANPTEEQIEALAKIADLVVNTFRCTEADVLTRANSHLGMRHAAGRGYVDVVVGGQYGSEGKGQIVDHLSGEYDLLIRVGGPNAGHSVFREPAPYVHHHLPSGTQTTSARLLIGPGAVLRVSSLLQEIEDCKLAEGRLTIDGSAMIITDKDIDREKGLVEAIGSTGQGVGAAAARRIMGRGGGVQLAKDAPELRPYIGSAYAVLQRTFASGGRALLEGTQGTGLSLYHGPYPHVTSRDTTVTGCLSEAGIPSSRVRKVVMVCRTHPIRVESPSSGSSGPLHEMTYAELSRRSGIPEAELRGAEKTSTTHKQRRLGEFEWDLLQRAAGLNAPTDIAVTFADYLGVVNRQAIRFEQLTEETINFIQEVERVTGTPATLIATGFSNRSIIDRRAW